MALFSPSVFVNGIFGGHDCRQSPEVCPGNWNLLQIELLVGGLQAVLQVVEAHVVNLVQVDAPVATTDATVKT